MDFNLCLAFLLLKDKNKHLQTINLSDIINSIKIEDVNWRKEGLPCKTIQQSKIESRN